MKETLYVHTTSETDLGGDNQIDRSMVVSAGDKDHFNEGNPRTIQGLTADEYAQAQAAEVAGVPVDFVLSFPAAS